MRPYLVAVLMLALAIVARLGLEPLLGSAQAWLTFWPAAFLSAWWGNTRAGVLTALGSIAIVLGWIVPVNEATLVASAVFGACTVGFAWLAGQARQARRAELAASRAKDEFLAMLGHELRNPLAPIATAVELMRMRGHQSRELDVIDRQVQHMSRLVDDLLDISRIMRGQLELRKAPIELRTAIDQAIEAASARLERTGHVVDIDVPDGLVVDADVQRLTRVFSNLLDNAIKYSPAGSPIAIRAERVNGRVRVRVIDRGSGIKPELLPRLFAPFVQESQQIDRAAGGLGLGLAIASKLVALHGGTITAASAGEGKGAEIIIELPLVPVVTQPESRGATKVPPQRILLVDDNQDVTALLSSLLEQWGHRVTVAHDGPQALKLAETCSPTLALVDIGLPVMDGYEVARQLRARGIDVPMIAITGYGQDRDREESKRAGFIAHMVKPVDVEQLGAAIQRLAAA